MNMEREEPQYPAEILADLEKPAAPASWLIHAGDPAQWEAGSKLRKHCEDAQRVIPTGLQIFRPAQGDEKEQTAGSVKVELELPAAITIVASKTGGGKTSALTELAARALSKDRPVVFFTAEEVAGQIAVKVSAKHTHIKTSGDTDHKPSDLSRLAADGTAPPPLQGLYLVNSVEDASGLNAETLEEQIRGAWTLLEKPLILLDYVQLIQPPAGANYTATYEKMKAVAGVLKRIAAEGIPIVLGAQLNRIGSKGTGKTEEEAFWSVVNEDIREAADIEQAAALILLAWIYGPRKENMWLRVMKDRSGRFINGAARYDIAQKSRALVASSCEEIKEEKGKTEKKRVSEARAEEDF